MWPLQDEIEHRAHLLLAIVVSACMLYAYIEAILVSRGKANLFPRQRVCVVGVGFVGHELVKVLSDKYAVVGYDVDEERIKALAKEFSLHRHVRFQSTGDGLAACNLFCIAVPTASSTSVDGAIAIDIAPLKQACAFVATYAQPGATVILESSVGVGMSRALLKPLRATGVFVAFSPERIDPGRAIPKTSAIHKIMGGIDDESLHRAMNWYRPVFDNMVPVSSLETAEMCKQYENCFRLVNIAYVNEVADACEAHGIDVSEMIAASATKPFGFMEFHSALGVGGNCIPENVHYFLERNRLPLLQFASMAVANRPVLKAQELVREFPTANRFLVVGIGYKRGQASIANSPGLAFADELVRLGKRVALHDNYASSHRHDMLSSRRWNSQFLDANFDIICTCHPLDVNDLAIVHSVKTATVVNFAR